jgi:DNA-binding CsgD family transcriptional regulator
VAARLDERDLARALAAVAGPACIEGAAMVAALPAGVATKRSEVISDAAFALSAYYNEVVRPLDGFHSLSVHNGRAAEDFFLTFCRPARAGDFGPVETGLLEVLLPHFLNAIELSRQLRFADVRSAGLEHIVDCLGAGVILTDAAARPAFVSQRAAEIIAEADGLGLDAAGLNAATPAATRALREAIAKACAAAGHARLRLHLARPSRRPSMIATLLPIWRLGIGGGGAACVAVVIDEPDAPFAFDSETLSEAFQLTRREAEVAALIGEGQSIGQIVAALGLSPGTVRNHLKRIFVKTDTHSQAALVGLLRGFAKPVSPIDASDRAAHGG